MMRSSLVNHVGMVDINMRLSSDQGRPLVDMFVPLVIVISGLLFAGVDRVCVAGDAKGLPNIVVIYGDDIGYGDFGCYGGTGADTANIDALADGGMRFTSAYCTAATCTPSRYSLLTGQYAFRNQAAKILPGNAPLIIDTDRPNLASFLRSVGYRTGLVGKWHLGLGHADRPLDWNGKIAPGPAEVGFDESFNMAATADRVPSVYIRDGRVVNLDPNDPIGVNYQSKIGDEPTGRSHPELLKVQADDQHSCTIVNGVSRIGYMTGGKAARFKDEDMADTYLNEAIDFVRRNKDQPFFLYYAPNENHVPRVIHPRFAGSSGLGPRGDALMVFDWCVGRFVETLRSEGLERNTLIILSSDNGPVLFDGYWDGAINRTGDHRAAGPWRGGKYSRWEGGTRMPLITYWPGTISPGVSDALISQVDLFRSIAALIKMPFPDDAAMDGQDASAALLGHTDQGRDFVIQEALTQLAVRQGDWKYLPPGSITERGGIDQWKSITVDEPGWLFNLADDPGELKNVAADHPDEVAQLRRIIADVAPEKVIGAEGLNKKQLGF
ncbi:Arylsulfatase [Crateriforma conspicua]|uniref:Arylsulfatase n=2 Tax=Crateriforma conspicua TaxID=2527996 RepID=A0A5C6FLU7_9PLAN|nr:Arylsulfatase [Crateriforma conspicua]